MEKKHQDILVVLILWVFTAVFFLLQVSSIWQTAIVVIIYTIMAGISLIVLLFLKSDDAYYENLTGTYLLYIIIASAVMYGVSLVCANYFPAAEAPLTTIPGATSITTGLISDVLFTVVMVALSEEALKLGGYAEFKERYKGHWYRWLIAIFPVVLWAGFHAIQAYNNLWFLIPAFVDGLVLLALLEVTHSFLAPVLAHGAYNTILIVTSYMVASSIITYISAIRVRNRLPTNYLVHSLGGLHNWSNRPTVQVLKSILKLKPKKTLNLLFF